MAHYYFTTEFLHAYFQRMLRRAVVHRPHPVPRLRRRGVFQGRVAIDKAALYRRN